MGKHVDTTRPVDADSRSPQWWPPTWPKGAHKDVWSGKPDDSARNYGADDAGWRDVWSGNPDTDKAWRDRLPGLDHLPWS